MGQGFGKGLGSALGLGVSLVAGSGTPDLSLVASQGKETLS